MSKNMQVRGSSQRKMRWGVSLVMAMGLSVAASAAQQPQYADQTNDAQVLSDALDNADPPSQVARISVLTGNASVQPASVSDFSPAEANYPLTTGDRIYTDVGATAELQTGQLAVRLGQQTDLTVTGVTDSLEQFGLAQGSVHLRSFQLDLNVTVELDTPSVAVTVLQPGDVRVDVDPNSGTTVVTLFSGQVEVDGNGIQQVMQPGQSLRLTGSSPVSARFQRQLRPDGLDRFSGDRDADYQASMASDGAYVNSETIGASDLGTYGDWQSDPDNGAVWYPRGVAVDWQPYSVGHWAWIAPWGWTWVESEPWGFAPFHYGRWARFGSRWGWIPGPPVIRPVWSPALVVFVGGGPRSSGVTAWFPLGPREPFVPWYHAGPQYVNRVNVTNIYSRNTAEVRRVYESRTNVYVNAQAPNRVFANRQVATVAMPQDRFAAGRPVAGNQVKGAPGQFAGAPILQHPQVTPERPIVSRGPAQALPPRMQRPTLASHEEDGLKPGQVTGRPGMKFGGPEPVTSTPAPVTRPVQGGVMPPNPGRTGPQQLNPQPQPTQRPGMVDPPNPGRTGPQQVNPQPQPTQRPGMVDPPNPGRTGPQQVNPQPAQRPTPGVIDPPRQTHTEPQQVNPQPTSRPGMVDPPNPGRTAPQQVNPAPVQQPRQEPQPEAQRPLYNRAVPPPARPSFEEQRQVIQQTEPGRPLSPQQMNTVRQQSQPAAQPQAAPRPAPAAAPKPAPAPPAKPEDKKKPG